MEQIPEPTVNGVYIFSISVWEVGNLPNRKKMGHRFLESLVGKLVFTETKKKKRDIVFWNHQLGGWFGSIQTEPNPFVEIMVETLNRCNPKKTGYTSRETLVERLDWMNSDRTEPIRGIHG